MTTDLFYNITNDSAAMRLLDVLESAGHEAWFVGGCVRDVLLNRPISDIDIACSAHWTDAKKACERAGFSVRETGVKHGTITVIVGAQTSSPSAYEVTTYRADSPIYSDSRRPDSVEFVSSIEEDLARRDFTINAIAWHPVRGIVDPYQGASDIASNIIRAVGDASVRFSEDALRILRACRFASQLGFSIEPGTFNAMVENKGLLTRVSVERTTHELDLLLVGPFAGATVLLTVDVLAVVMPELVAMKSFPQLTKYHCFDVLEHTCVAIDYTPPDRLVRWATLCHDMGKPACAFYDDAGVVHFYGHALVSERMALGIANRMLMSRKFKSDLCKLVSSHDDQIQPTRKSVRKAIVRMDGNVDLLQSLLTLKRADRLASAPEFRFEADVIDEIAQVLDVVIAEDGAFSLSELAINGNDLQDIGMRPGKDIGLALECALQGVVADEVANEKDALLAYVQKCLYIQA